MVIQFEFGINGARPVCAHTCARTRLLYTWPLCETPVRLGSFVFIVAECVSLRRFRILCADFDPKRQKKKKEFTFSSNVLCLWCTTRGKIYDAHAKLYKTRARAHYLTAFWNTRMSSSNCHLFTVLNLNRVDCKKTIENARTSSKPLSITTIYDFTFLIIRSVFKKKINKN